MLLADLKLPRIVVPPSVRHAAKQAETFTSGWDVPLGASDWIACCYALPHNDPTFHGQLFLTLSVLSSHDIGDAVSTNVDLPVPRGRLFVIDPMARHWLFPVDAWRSTRVKPWIGLQWTVSRRRAKAVARDLVHRFDGSWLHSDDKRYAGWQPESNDAGSPRADAPCLEAAS